MERFPNSPTPERVHDLRTDCRRLEAVLHAFALDGSRKGRRLLKTAGPIRKAAGKVRNMDVLTGLAASMVSEEASESIVRLVEKMATRRSKLVERLLTALDQKGKRAGKLLAQCQKRIQRRLEDTRNDGGPNGRRATDPLAALVEISAELTAWPKLRAGNLHPFRLKVKELRYVLDLSGAPDASMSRALREVKDSIGEWHDWCELEKLVAETIGNNAGIRSRIRSVIPQKLDRALALANKVRQRYFVRGAAGLQRNAPQIHLKGPALSSAAKMSA
jgi:CHAD domain-containing protein